jgi:hypothetical protein
MSWLVADRRSRRVAHARARWGLLTIAVALVSAPLCAEADQTSAGFAIRGSHFGALGSASLSSASYSSGVSAGQGEALGHSGSAVDLSTLAPGFWPVVAGGLPGLDADGDGVRYFDDNCSEIPNALQLDFDLDGAGDECDADDDGDGLLDTVETDTGVFVGPLDTGTNPFDADSDGDGWTDGDELEGGSDPNDALSTPLTVPPAIPVLGWLARGLLAAAMLALSAVYRRANRFQEDPR